MIDPYHEYAVAFARLAFERYDLPTFCVHTSAKARYYRARQWNRIPPEALLGAIELGEGDDVRAAAPLLMELVQPVAVIPLVEQSMVATFELADALGVLWSPLDVLRRFRDKYSMKSHLRAAAPDLRINDSRPVGSAADVFGQELPSRFVIKPNAGHGNHDIGIFTVSDRERVERFLAERPEVPMVLEEFIEGTEYFVNGQTDVTGAIRILAAFEYERLDGGLSETVTIYTRKVSRDEPVFAVLSDYVTRVVEATGLRRSAFHMDVRVDDEGASLIEVGARLAGMGNVFDCNTLHGGAVDLFDLALCQLLDPSPFGDFDVDWRSYDRHSLLYVHGVSTSEGVVAKVIGVDEVEAMPEFHRWVLKPRTGRRMVRTIDLHSIPYLAVLINSGDEAGLKAAGSRLRDTLQFNRQVSMLRSLLVRLGTLTRRVRLRLGWMAHLAGSGARRLARS